MRKTTKKLVAVLMLVAVMVSALSVSALAANRTNVKQYPNYVCLGDSVASGFGLPDYNAKGKILTYNTKIQGAYGTLIARAVGATKGKGGTYYPGGYPGFTSAIFRCILTDNYYPR